MFSPPCFTFYLNLEPNLVLKENNQNKCIKKKYYFDINADWKKKKNACRKFLQQPKIIFRGNVKSNSWWYCMADDDAWWRRWRWPPLPRCQMQLQMTISFFITLLDFLLFITFSSLYLFIHYVMATTCLVTNS